MNDLKFKVLSLKPVSRKNDYFHVNLDNGDKYNFHRNSISQYNIKENQLIENIFHSNKNNILQNVLINIHVSQNYLY